MPGLKIKIIKEYKYGLIEEISENRNFQYNDIELLEKVVQSK